MGEKILHERLIGQHHAITAVSKAVRRARVGIQDPKRPIASFIFAGPTGVGKTELTKTLAEYMFDDEKNLIRFDMSEYMERPTVAKLIGSPPGYVGFQEGGQLTEAVRQKPYSIILFDEVEKAHPDVFNIFLQILDDGHLTDSSGRVVSFKNTIIVMTTNLGSKVIERESPVLPKENIGFGNNPNATVMDTKRIELLVSTDGTFSLKAPVKKEITKFFRPEFLNRIDDIIVFNHLSKYDIWEICGLMLNSLKKRLEEQNVILNIDNAVRYFLSEEGYDPIYGARPLRRSITKFLEDKLAEECLTYTLHEGTQINVTQQIQPNVYGNKPVYLPKFDDIYTREIIINFDYSKVDFTLLKGPEKKKREKTSC